MDMQTKTGKIRRVMHLLLAVVWICGAGCEQSGEPRDGELAAGSDPEPRSPTAAARPDGERAGVVPRATVAPDAGGSVEPYLFDRAVTLGIGIEDYRFLEDAPLAEADARAVAALLRDRYGFTPDTSLIGPRATKQNILGAFDNYAEDLGGDDVLVVFIAGHGQVINLPIEPGRPPRREGFIIPYEARLELDDHRDPDAWRREAIAMDELLGRVRAMRARHVLLIVDTCCSGFMTDRGAIKYRRDLQFLLNEPSRAVLAATTDNQLATPDPELGHGQFTAALLDELRSWADRGEAASLTDVFGNIRHQVSRATGAAMVPQMNPRLGEDDGEFVFLPKSLRSADIAYVARLAREPRPAEAGRGHVLSDVLRRARERANLQATVAEVIEAFQAPDYRFGTEAAAKEKLWRSRRERYLDQATAGDVLAMAALHYCDAKGLGIDRPDEAEALRWARLAYDSERPAGKHVLGRCLLEGIGTEQNELAARRLIEEAADEGFPISQYSVAAREIKQMEEAGAFDAERLAAARTLAERAAEAGVARATEQLALLDLAATPLPGIERDVIRGIARLRAAADTDLPSAQAELAKVLAGALPDAPPDLPRDLAAAQEYLTAAADAGYAPAQFVLAGEYLRGDGPGAMLGLRRDEHRARRLLELAAEQDFTPSLMLLSEMYETGDGASVDHGKARRYCERAAELGDTDAFVTQGRWYRDGVVYRRDDLRAMQLFRRAAEEGNPVGCRMVGLMLDEARGVELGGHPRAAMEPYFKFRALHWYIRALQLGDDPVARRELELFYRDYRAQELAAALAFGDDSDTPERREFEEFYREHGDLTGERYWQEGYDEVRPWQILEELRANFPASGAFFDELFGIDDHD